MVCSCFAVYVMVNETWVVPYFESCMETIYESIITFYTQQLKSVGSPHTKLICIAVCVVENLSLNHMNLLLQRLSYLLTQRFLLPDMQESKLILNKNVYNS